MISNDTVSYKFNFTLPKGKKKASELVDHGLCDSGLSSSFPATGIKAYEEWQHLATYLQVYKNHFPEEKWLL